MYSFVTYLSILFIFHLFPLSLLLNLIFEEKIEVLSMFKNVSNTIIAILLLVPTILFNYIYFIKMEKLQDTIKEFQNKKLINKYWVLIITLYVVLLFILMIVEREYFKAKIQVVTMYL